VESSAPLTAMILPEHHPVITGKILIAETTAFEKNVILLTKLVALKCRIKGEVTVSQDL
jgi:hypothetical protein